MRERILFLDRTNRLSVFLGNNVEPIVTSHNDEKKLLGIPDDRSNLEHDTMNTNNY